VGFSAERRFLPGAFIHALQLLSRAYLAIARLSCSHTGYVTADTTLKSDMNGSGIGGITVGWV